MDKATIKNTPPDIDGYARAWRLKFDTARAKASANSKADDSTICGWIVNAPWAHPLWPNYGIVCVHLRDMPGQTKPPTISLPGATHEITVLAINPDWTPEIDPDGLRYLTPVNFVGQFKAVSDDAAAAIIDVVVARICAGTLNPDTDATSQWVHLFGDHAFKANYRNGVMGTVNEGVPL